jgi:hypothetical protein
MVSTLRITSVVAIFLAALVVGLVAGPSSLVPNLLVGFALRSDPEIQRILSEPSVVDQFKLEQGDHAGARSDTTPALVREAESFKNIIDPPPTSVDAVTKQPGRTAKGPTVIKPVPSSAKFDLVGTTVSTDNSFAYVRLQDKTYQWARKGDEIGHLVIKEIKDGSIVCWDGHADIEMTTESVPETASLLEVGGPSLLPGSSQVGSLPAEDGRITGRPVARPWASQGPATQGGDEMSDQERQALDLVGQIRELRQGGTSAPDANLSPEDREAAVKKLMAEYKSSRVSPEEAEKVEDLGRELNESAEPSPAEKLRDIRRRLNIPRAIPK